jgi:septal ring factor EnvC (AmiA/AmiB activator)
MATNDIAIYRDQLYNRLVEETSKFYTLEIEIDESIAKNNKNLSGFKDTLFGLKETENKLEADIKKMRAEADEAYKAAKNAAEYVNSPVNKKRTQDLCRAWRELRKTRGYIEHTLEFIRVAEECIKLDTIQLADQGNKLENMEKLYNENKCRIV